MCVYDVTDPAGDAVVLERQWGVEKGEVVLVTLNTIRQRVASEGWIVQDLPELGSGAFSEPTPPTTTRRWTSAKSTSRSRTTFCESTTAPLPAT